VGFLYPEDTFMPVTAVKTQATELYYAVSSILATKIGQIDSAPSPLGGVRAQIDITTLDSTEHEYAGGLATPVSETFGIVFNPKDASHVALINLKNSGTVVPWWVGLSDGALAPTVIAGESTKSIELSVTTTGSTSSNTLVWPLVSGATGYRIYRGTSAGTEGVYYTVGAVATLVDTGAANVVGTPPAANTAILPVPGFTSVVTSASGGTLAAATYFYVITATNTAAGQFVNTQVARTFFTFNGYVADLVLSAPLNNVVKGTVTIQRSGPPVFSAST
jgi:hypothetical protein